MIGLVARGIGLAVLADLCWHALAVRAWTLLPIFAALLVWLLLSSRRCIESRRRRRRHGTDFIRPRFPDQAKRPIR